MSGLSSGIENMRPHRIAIVHYRDDAMAGGSLRVGQSLADSLDPEKVEAHLVFAYGEDGAISRRVPVKCHFLKARGPKDIRAWIRARRLMRIIKPDVIHFMDSVVWLNIALVGTGYKKLLHIHGKFLPSYMKWSNRVLRKGLGLMADGQVCITYGSLEALNELGWGRRGRTWVVPNAINSKMFANLPERDSARAALNLPSGVRLLGMICRIVKHRGGEDAIEILRRLDHSWHLVFCGEGPFRNELEAKAERDGVRGRVHFIGPLDDVRPALAAIDAFLFLARYDSFGLATCEALAAGVPVFGLAGEGEYREPQYPLLTDANSILVERRNASNYEMQEAPEALDDLAHHIMDYGEYPQRYQRMIRHGQDWVQSRFDGSIQAEAMSQIYDLLTSQRGQ